MIAFHNDHLVSPVLCEVLYNTIPGELHAPVIFYRFSRDGGMSGCRGRVYINPDRRKVQINLFGIFNDGKPKEFDIWKLLLFVCYHEFGHLATLPLWGHLDDTSYENNPHAHMQVERLADDWADCAIARLLRYDKRLCQPASIGPFIGGIIVNKKKRWRKWQKQSHAKKGSAYSHMIQEWRKYKSGGQLSTGEVAYKIGAYKPHTPESPYKSDTRLVRKLAPDLAYAYMDKAGRKHMFFAYGDLPEIKRRFDRYKEINRPTPTEQAYQAYLAEREAEKKHWPEPPF